MGATIEYKGVVTTVESGHSAVVRCAGDKMESEVIVTADEGGDTSASLTGTAVPVGEYVERIYFNTNLSIEETNAYLSQLTYEGDTAIFFGAQQGSTLYAVLASKSGEAYEIIIANLTMREDELILSDTVTVLSETYGWYSEIGLGMNCAVSGFDTSNFTPLTEFQGFSIGLENEKIKNVISITPFAKVEKVEPKLQDKYVSIDITDSGEHRINPDEGMDGLSSVTYFTPVVDVTSRPDEVSTEDEMNAILENQPIVGSIYKYTGETTDTYENGALYIVEAVE